MIIYKITNLISKKVYIGQTKRSIIRRWNDHICDLNSNRHHNKKLQRAWNKYGETAWQYDSIAMCDTPEEADALEIKYIDEYNSINNGYNIYRGSSRNYTNDRNFKISKSLKRNKNSINHKQTPEHIEKRRIQHLKTFVGFISPDKEIFSPIYDLPTFCRERNLSVHNMHSVDKGIRKRCKGWIKYNPNMTMDEHFNHLKNSRYHHSEETKSKMSSKRKGIKYSKETISKMKKAARHRYVNRIRNEFGQFC